MSMNKVLRYSFISLILLLLLFPFYLSTRTEIVQTFNVTIPIIEEDTVVSFSVDPDALSFGKMGPDRGAVRYVNLKNNDDGITFYHITVGGDAKELLIYHKRPFYLPAGGEEKVAFQVITGNETTNRTYTGAVVISSFDLW